MRGHLTDREMTELVAGTLDGATVAHLRACDACRKEYARLNSALADFAIDVRARAERSDAFLQRQRVRIACRAGGRRPFVWRWKNVWAPALATGALVAVLLTRGGTPPRSPAESQLDQALLSAVHHAIHREVPVALSPAALLVADVERGAGQPSRTVETQKGEPL